MNNLFFWSSIVCLGVGAVESSTATIAHGLVVFIVISAACASAVVIAVVFAAVKRDTRRDPKAPCPSPKLAIASIAGVSLVATLLLLVGGDGCPSPLRASSAGSGQGCLCPASVSAPVEQSQTRPSQPAHPPPPARARAPKTVLFVGFVRMGEMSEKLQFTPKDEARQVAALFQDFARRTPALAHINCETADSFDAAAERRRADAADENKAGAAIFLVKVAAMHAGRPVVQEPEGECEAVVETAPYSGSLIAPKGRVINYEAGNVLPNGDQTTATLALLRDMIVRCDRQPTW